MPLLEYRCGACGVIFERLVRNTANQDSADCPSCKEGRGQRMLSMFASIRGGDGACMAESGAMASAMGAGGCCGGGACGV